MNARHHVWLTATMSMMLCLGEVAGAAERAPAPDRQPGVQGFEKVNPPAQITIMLVDDDWNFTSTVGGGRPYYTSALDALGESYVVWDTESQGAPTTADMAPHDLVIWFTGYDWQTPIEPADETQLQAYLDGGGKLILSSQDYHYYAGTVTPFMQNYLGVGSVIDDVTQLDPVGNAGDPVGNGLGPYAMVRPDAWEAYWPSAPYEGPYDDQVDPGAGAFSPFNYQAMAVSASTRYASGPFRTIFLGWPFEWIGPLADRQEILAAMIDWSLATGLPFSDGFESGDTSAWSATVP